MGLVLDISPRILERVLYFSAYIVTDVSDDITEIQKGQVLTEKEYQDYKEKYEDDFHAGMGAETIKKLLEEINLEELSAQLREDLENATGQSAPAFSSAWKSWRRCAFPATAPNG